MMEVMIEDKVDVGERLTICGGQYSCLHFCKLY